MGSLWYINKLYCYKDSGIPQSGNMATLHFVVIYYSPKGTYSHIPRLCVSAWE